MVHAQAHPERRTVDLRRCRALGGEEKAVDRELSVNCHVAARKVFAYLCSVQCGAAGWTVHDGRTWPVHGGGAPVDQGRSQDGAVSCIACGARGHADPACPLRRCAVCGAYGHCDGACPVWGGPDGRCKGGETAGDGAVENVAIGLAVSHRRRWRPDARKPGGPGHGPAGNGRRMGLGEPRGPRSQKQRRTRDAEPKNAMAEARVGGWWSIMLTASDIIDDDDDDNDGGRDSDDSGSAHRAQIPTVPRQGQTLRGRCVRHGGNPCGGSAGRTDAPDSSDTGIEATGVDHAAVSPSQPAGTARAAVVF